MRFELDDDQRDFAAALDALLGSADTAAVARAWAQGDHGPGIRLWSRLTELGLTSLATDATPVEVAVAFEALGRHAVPGPWVESAAYLPVALGHEVDGIATVALPPHVPYALDADVADHVYVGSTPAESVGARVGSVDRTRRLFPVTGEGEPDREAFDLAVLATSAQLLGAGERVLTDAVAYVKQRKQFGREIGSYQAIKHALADVRIALDFARPLVYGAALGAVDVSAAKIAAGDAAYRSSRTGLQVHGAIGYTQELDLSLWLTKIRALVTAWGTPAFHRTRIRQQLGVGLMQFALTEEQQELAATVRSLLEKRGDARAETYDRTLWSTLCEQIGVAALNVPEEHDGFGASLFESLVVLEEIGRSLVPSPLLSTLVTSEALLAGADDEARARLLPRIAGGEVAALVDGDAPVLDGDLASIVVVATDDGLYEVEHPQATWTPSMDQTLRLASVHADLSTARRIGDGPAARDRARQVGAVGCAALAAGLATRALEMTVAYSKERVQFGRPIGSFQALKHRMADMLVLAEMSRSASWAASYAVATQADDADQLTHVAKSYCTDALSQIAAETVQLHGGIAITWEHDAHLVFKRAHALGQLFGTAREHRAAVAL